ncbi:MAG TPA: hypothetical protein VMP01_27915 [Pirellulaceae bacterium]|nr:hypothetical protein [Pirellulaceae bacterium]
MKLRLSLWIVSMAAISATLGCAAAPYAHNLPPAQQLLEPGPGVGGPGPGVLAPMLPPQMIPISMPTVQVLFAKPDAMQVRWDVGGVGMFDSTPLVVPARQNFPQNGIYRLKITEIAGRAGVELYPTLEIGPTTPRSEAFLAHNAIPVQFTEEDFDQVLVGNFVTKVIYLPDPEFQDLALAGVDTLVSTRLDPGVDPIVEADRRGAILAVIRLGNKDIELAGAEGGFPGGVAADAAAYMGMPYGAGGYCGPSLPPNYVAGVTAPLYGMPITGTPIGLPGPPHIPLGVPAGLQRHTIKNHTHMHIPEPVDHFRVHVRQQPGMSYPKPVHKVHIREQSIHPSLPFDQPHSNMHQRVGTSPYGAAGAGFDPAYCPPGMEGHFGAPVEGGVIEGGVESAPGAY